MRAGPWLRLCGVGASAAGVLVVVSGELGITHRALVGVAAPLLVALVLGAWFAHRAVFPFALAALLLFGGAAAYLIQREWRGAARLRAPRDS